MTVYNADLLPFLNTVTNLELTMYLFNKAFPPTFIFNRALAIGVLWNSERVGIGLFISKTKSIKSKITFPL